MQRIPIPQRPELEKAAVEHGYDFHADTAIPFWDETAYYRFTLAQIERDLEAPANEIERMCFAVLDRSLSDETVMRRLKIPEPYWDYVADSWRSREKDLYGRLDFAYDGAGPAKLYEYNADTPTTLYETAVFQWEWLEQSSAVGSLPGGCDQFNEIHEDLLDAFRGFDYSGCMHFACLKGIEDDQGTVDYLEECAQEAGLTTCSLSMKDIGVDAGGKFTDLEDYVIEILFKLYPWEWIMEEEFGQYLPGSGVHFIEPPWKAILSNKGLLALLWEMFEGHPNLLPTYFGDDPKAANLEGRFVRKPLLSRRGQNIEIVDGDKLQIRVDGPYGAEGHVVQEFHPLPEFARKYPLLGCWMIAGQATGLGIRESLDIVTTETACFVPHVILE
jgi:glutathionylspermidine synthase